MLREALATTPDSPNVQYWHLGLATALARQHQTAEALEEVVKGVELVRRTNNAELLPTAVSTLAFVKRTAGDLDGALSAAREAIDAVEALRAKLVPIDFMKRGFSDASQESFDQAVSVLQQLGRAGEAFELAERARARALLDLLATREARATASDASAPGRAAATNAGGIDVLAAEREVLLRTEKSAPPATLDDMARLAARLKSTILAYWVSSDATIIWVITPDRQARAARVEIAATELTRLIGQTWATSDTTIARRGENASASQKPMRIAAPPAGPWRRLHDLLISPVAAFLPTSDGARLTIIPHRALFRLSFAGLRDSHQRYLVERYALHYASAGGALAFTERRDAELRQTVGMRLLLVADPAPLPRAAEAPGQATLPELPEALREARTIAEMFPRGTVTLLEGSMAGEADVREALRGKEVLHFATHAIVSDARPLDSFLALGSDAGTTGFSSSDGRLTAAEIYDLKIDSRLVVLSACRTAAGKVSGDGILGLSRALFYAGTPAIVAAMWDVSDETTRVLMEHFYREWPERSRGDALRAAQLRLLRDLRAGRIRIQTTAGPAIVPNHPYYWAGFVLLGEF
jgi:CHAT domain-containing protein